MFDDKPDVLPAHSVSDVALYVGWYAVGGYVPSCSFAGGAVAMHVASYTLVSLRTPGQTNWAAGLIDDGAVATIGPVAEPYLFAFPRADDFFPLLMTGRLTLAECYWRTEPVVSWQMTCVGDPLYTPYRADPQLAVADLPARLRGLFRPRRPARSRPGEAAAGRGPITGSGGPRHARATDLSEPAMPEVPQRPRRRPRQAGQVPALQHQLPRPRGPQGRPGRAPADDDEPLKAAG